MAAKGEELATEFEKENASFIEFVGALTPEQWKAECPGEGWTVGVVAHHIADDHRFLGDLVNTIANGGTVPVLTADYINSLNAGHAERAADCTPEETIEVAREHGARAAEIFRSLSDEQLAHTAVMPVAGGEVSAVVVSEMIVIGHIGMHRSSIEEVIAS